MQIDVTTYHLEMTDPGDLSPKLVEYPGLSIDRVQVASPEINSFMYRAVGGDWRWEERLPWTYQQWQQWVNRPELQTWVALISGDPVGYFELESQLESGVEITSFGMVPSFIGRGLGGHLLTVAVQEAWRMGVRRVWLHTCSLDHPSALPNYQARGFRVFHESTVAQEIQEQAAMDCPGADGTSL